jgi:hypothetical protein
MLASLHFAAVEAAADAVADGVCVVAPEPKRVGEIVGCVLTSTRRR